VRRHLLLCREGTKTGVSNGVRGRGGYLNPVDIRSRDITFFEQTKDTSSERESIPQVNIGSTSRNVTLSLLLPLLKLRVPESVDGSKLCTRFPKWTS
jgi:hypothetical protein